MVSGTLAPGLAVASGEKAESVQAGTRPPNGFGTINGFGQSAEHEKITRAALACHGGEPANACFQPVSLNQLAGGSGTFGAVGSPDSDQTLTGAAHCDGADFLDVPGYPQTRAQATAALLSCVSHLRSEFATGVDKAQGVLSAGKVLPGEVDLSSSCTFTLGVPGRAKCNAIEGFGRALHGIQDFYAHSNWTDAADPARPVGVENPPGLRQSGPAPFLRLNAPAPTASDIPRRLGTECYTLAPFGWGCGGRVTHDVVNKDTGTIDPTTGATSAPTTPRGKVAGNFDHAVQAAILDTRTQWKGFQDALTATYGSVQGGRLACVITHDDPVHACA
ncbi:CinY protein [Streptomyces sp. NPDC048514]|uniref:CinY protein n=1 Tax=Streptomyces sp. NPDC048514 TaxID=3365564 RepID=UPI00371435D9